MHSDLYLRTVHQVLLAIVRTTSHCRTIPPWNLLDTSGRSGILPNLRNLFKVILRSCRRGEVHSSPSQPIFTILLWFALSSPILTAPSDEALQGIIMEDTIRSLTKDPYAGDKIFLTLRPSNRAACNELSDIVDLCKSQPERFRHLVCRLPKYA